MASSSSSSSSKTLTLIPGLPNDISALILSSLPLPLHSRLRLTSRSWRLFFSSPSPLLLRRRLRLRLHLLALFPSDPSPPLLFDPVTLSFLPLPSLPTSPHLFHLSNPSPLFLFPHLYLLGGSLFDARSFPLNLPIPSPSAHRLDLTYLPLPLPSWSPLPDMPSPRGSFAAAAHEPSRTILVAGGGSRHRVYPSDGTRIKNVEVLDAESGEWRVGEGLERCRAGCVGFMREGEFWVMGGYGEYTTVGGVVPRDVYCRDAVAMGLESGRWREVGDMWDEGERRRLGKVGVVEGEDGQAARVFMLDRNEIFRFDFATNRWLKETSLRKKLPSDDSCCFAAMNGELYVLTSEPRSSPKKRPTLEIQVYNPIKRKWKFLTTSVPFKQAIDFKSAVSCTVKL